MNKSLFLFICIVLILLSACQPQASKCLRSTGTPNFIIGTPPEVISSATPGSNPTAMMVEIGGKMISVDKIIEGPLCNDTWSGKVYVTCDIQIYAWEDQPTFLKNCDLKIDPETVVFVAYHNDTAYYNGCSCHTTEIAEP